MNTLKIAIASLLVVFLPTISSGMYSYTAIVSKVIDGDTIQATAPDGTKTLHLAYADASDPTPLRMASFPKSRSKTVGHLRAR